MTIGKKLQGTPVAGTRKAATIKRILAGNLDVQRARRKAVAAGSKSRTKP
jgi:hypothetical protein